MKPLIRVIGKETSINVRKVLWCLDIIGCDYEHINSIDKLELQALNPNGLVPVLMDGKLLIWQSNTILRYLGRKFNESNLYGEDISTLALIDQWLDWQATEFNTSWNYAFQALVRKNTNFKDKSQIEKSLSDWNNCVSILDTFFSKNKFSSGDEFKISDIALTLSLNRWYKTTKQKGAYINVDRYFKDCSKMPFFNIWVSNGIP